MLKTPRKFLAPPSFTNDENKTRSAYYLNIIALVSIPALVLFLVFRLAQGNKLVESSNLVLFALIVILSVVLTLNRLGAVRLAGYIHISTIWIASTLLALTGSGIRGSGFVSYFVVMLLAGLILGVWPAVGIAIVSVISGFGLAYAENAGIIVYIPGPAIGVAGEFTFLFIFATLFMVLTINGLKNTLSAAQANAKGLEVSNKELTELRDVLEIRIQERTASLERRAAQLQTVSSLARTIASMQDLDILLPNVTRLVSEKFGFYHTGIFLLDDAQANAVLKAANSEGGKRMRDREHQLPLDSSSIVGYVTSRGEPRIALDVGVDAVYFNNPDLPDTRSEMAVPLRVSGQVIGALDVQSTKTNAFSDEDVLVLSTLADQVAIAIENARLFGDAQNALAESQSTFERYLKQEWSNFTRQVRYTGFLFDGKQVTPMENSAKQEQTRAAIQTGSLVLEKGTSASSVSIPVKLRGQTIGVLDVRSKKGQRDWTREEITLLEAAAERAALALENARLLESAQRRAARERAIGEISTRIGEFSSIDTILQATVEELGRKIGGGAEIMIELGDHDKQGISQV